MIAAPDLSAIRLDVPIPVMHRARQHFDGPVELHAGFLEVTGFELSLAGFEMTLGALDEGSNRVDARDVPSGRLCRLPGR